MSQASDEFSLLPALMYIFISLLFIAGSIAIYWPLPELAFLSDNSPLSWLSSAQLWALALLTLRLTTERVLPLVLGAWLSLGMVYMAFDEQFLWHEQWKYSCVDWLALCRYSIVTNLPLELIGIAGIFTAYRLHLTLSHKNAKRFLWAAMGVGGFAIWLDLVGGFEPLQPLEEGFEVLAEALFIAMLLGSHKPRAKMDDDALQG